MKAFVLAALALAVCATGIYVADTATEPRGAVIALLLMIGAVRVDINAVLVTAADLGRTHHVSLRGAHGGVCGIL